MTKGRARSLLEVGIPVIALQALRKRREEEWDLEESLPQAAAW